MNRKDNAFLLNLKRKSKVEGIIQLLKMLNNHEEKSNQQTLDKLLIKLPEVEFFVGSVNTYQAVQICKAIGFNITRQRLAQFKQKQFKRDAIKSRKIEVILKEISAMLFSFAELLIQHKMMENITEVIENKSVSNLADYEIMLPEKELALEDNIAIFMEQYNLKIELDLEEKKRQYQAEMHRKMNSLLDDSDDEFMPNFTSFGNRNKPSKSSVFDLDNDLEKEELTLNFNFSFEDDEEAD